MTASPRQYLVFLGLGPLIGLAVLMGLSLAVNQAEPSFSAKDFAGWLIATYLLGGLPALAAARLVTRVRPRAPNRQVPYVTAVGLLVGIAFAAAMMVPMLGIYGLTPSAFLHPLTLFVVLCCIATSLVATLICWAVVRMIETLGYRSS